MKAGVTTAEYVWRHGVMKAYTNWVITHFYTRQMSSYKKMFLFGPSNVGSLIYFYMAAFWKLSVF